MEMKMYQYFPFISKTIIKWNIKLFINGKETPNR